MSDFQKGLISFCRWFFGILFPLGCITWYVFMVGSIILLAIDLYAGQRTPYIDRMMFRIVQNALLGFVFFLGYSALRPQNANLKEIVYGITIVIAFAMTILSAFI